MLDTLGFFAAVIAGSILIAGVAFVLGRAAAQLLLLRFDSLAEETACSLAAGLGIIALVVFLLGVTGILFEGVLFSVVGLLLVGSIALILGAKEPLGHWRSVHSVQWVVLLLVVLLFFPVFLLPLYPPTATDAITYHLAVAKQYVLTGTVQPTPQFRYVVFPQLAEMLFTAALMLGSDILAQCISLMFLLITALAIVGFVRRTGYATSSWWGAAMFLSNSAVLALGYVAFVDMALTAFVTLAVVSFERWYESRNEGWLVFSGLMMGCASGTKYSALFFPLVLGIYVTLESRRVHSVRPALTLMLSTFISALPWYLYNAHHTGNPVWPFFSGVFGHAYWSDADLHGQTMDLLNHYGTGRGVGSLLTLPWNIFAHIEYFHTEGELSKSLLIGVPFAILAVVRKGYARRIALVGVSFALFWFYTAQILRYLIPVLPLLCVLATVGMSYLFRWFFPSRPMLRTLVAAGIALLLIFPGWQSAIHTVTVAGMPPTTAEQREQYLEKHLPSYGALRFLHRTRGNVYTLYSYGDARLAYYAEGKFRGDHFGPWRYSRVSGLLDGREDDLLRELTSMGVSHLLVRDDPGGSECKPAWLERKLVIPVYRSPGVTLFAVEHTPFMATFGPEAVIPGAGLSDSTLTGGIRFVAHGELMYYSQCVGSSSLSPTTTVFQMKWLGQDGRWIRTDETSGVLTPRGDTLRVLSTAPPAATSAQISCSSIGGLPISVVSLSLCTLRFDPLTH